MSDLDRLRRAMMVPHASLPFFGANVCHTPALEGQSVANCSRCGGAHKAPNGKYVPAAGPADPVHDYEVHVRENGGLSADPLTVVCGCCGRSVYEGTTALAKAIKTGADPSRPPPPAEYLRQADADRTAEAISVPAGRPTYLPRMFSTPAAEAHVAAAVAAGRCPVVRTGMPKGPEGRAVLREARLIAAGRS